MIKPDSSDDRYDLKTINEADFYQFPTPEEQYAYWVRNVSVIRYDYPLGKPYLDLHSIIKDKNHVILTTNTDGQFFKPGFDTDKICLPQGDLSFFQCSLLKFVVPINCATTKQGKDNAFPYWW